MSPALHTFTSEWARLSWPLTSARVSRIVHTAAFTFALGAITSLYIRGIAFEYRAGWESTFLAAEEVHRLLRLVLAPASAVTGIAVPDAHHINAINFANGPGENASRWIHLYAATIALFVLLPRALLAAVAWWRQKRYTRHFPLSTSEPYFQSILRRHRGETARIRVVPYSYTLSPQATLALNTLLTRAFGTQAEVSVVPVAFGEEDALPAGLVPPHAPALLVALFSLAATPEAENHGMLVTRLIERAATATPVIAMIDETGFRERFANEPERHEERRMAWRRIIETTGLGREPIFVDLLAPNQTQAEAALSSAINNLPAKS